VALGLPENQTWAKARQNLVAAGIWALVHESLAPPGSDGDDAVVTVVTYRVLKSFGLLSPATA